MNTSLTERMKDGLGFVLSQSLIGNSCWLSAVCLLATTTAVPVAKAYTTADLAGSWHTHALATSDGANPGWDNGVGWDYGSGTISAAGIFSGVAQEYLNSHTGVISGVKFSLNAAGECTVANGAVTHGHMAVDTNMIVMVEKRSSPDVSAMRVFTRQGASYQTSDLAGTWQGHALASGSGAPWWQRYSLTMDANGLVTVVSTQSNNGADKSLPSQFVLSASDGVVTVSGASDSAAYGFWHGHMAADKDTLVLVHTWDTVDAGTSELLVLTRQAAAYRISDLAGTWYMADIVSNPGAPWWMWGHLTIDTNGVFSSGLVDYDGEPDHSSARFAIDAAGEVRWDGRTTDPTAPGYFHGHLSADKNTIVYNTSWSTYKPGATQMGVLTRASGGPFPVLTWANPAAITYGAALSAAQLNAKASVPGQFVYSPAAGAKLPAGTNVLNVTFTPTDTNRYYSTTKSVALIVNKASQTITFKPLPTVELGVTNFSAGATASSGLGIEYASASPAVAEIVDGLIHVTGSGTAVITASQPGNTDYKPASPGKQQMLTVKARLTTEVSGGTGTVSGAGLYLPGAKVALTARPAAGSTFLRWEDGSQAAARSYAMPNANATVSAWFAPTTNIPPPVVESPGAVRVTVGVAFSLPLAVRSDSLPAVTVTGLPAGLSYSAATKLVTGVPTASVTNKPVSIKAVNVNKTPGTNTFFMTVDPLPVWAQGTFNGAAGKDALGSGLATLSVTPVGGISGKITLRGTNFAISAASYSYRERKGAFCLATTAKVSRVALPLTLYVSAPVITDTTGRVPPTLGKVDGDLGADSEVLLYRNVWKDAGMAAVATNYTGYYTAVLPGGGDFGSGYLLLTVDKAGGVKTTGKLADGTAVSLSGALLLDEAGRALTALQAAPAAYLGGSLFGLAEWVEPAAGGRLFVRAYAGSSFLWDSLNPQATGSYSAGFHRRLGLDGGWYDTLGNLRAYYTNGTLRVGTDGLPVPELLVGTNRYDAVRWDPCGITLSVVTNRGGVMTGLAAPKTGAPVKAGTNGYDYASVTNAVGLTIGLTRATGVFKGAFNAWFDYPKTHTSKNILYEGALTPEREDKEDGSAGRGFFLWADKSQYTNPQNKAVLYTFNWSYDLKILMPDDMVLVPGGSLPDSGSGAVTVQSFTIGRCEVTWAEWRAVRDWAAANGYDLGSVGEGSADNHPVCSVNWYDCVKWCNARSEKEGRAPAYYTDAGFTSVYKAGEVLEPFVNAAAGGYRLPTDAEWAFAARGGTRSRGYEYSGGNDLNAVGWYWDNSAGAAADLYSGHGTWPVGAKAANELGLCDMSGNVYEWCFEWYPGYVGSLRVSRGGSWINNSYDCRSAYRYSNFPYFRDSFIGFRAARILP